MSAPSAPEKSAVPVYESLVGSRVEVNNNAWLITATLLGRGGFASVYRAFSAVGHNTNRAAIKVVDLRKQRGKWAAEKLRLEQQALVAAQSHPNIVRFDGAVQRGPYHIFVFEEWGQDLLEQVLKHRGLGAGRTLQVLEQVLAALEWLHSKSICHGCVPAALAPPARRKARRALVR